MAFNLWNPRANEEGETASHPGIFRASCRKSKSNSPSKQEKYPLYTQAAEAAAMVWSSPARDGLTEEWCSTPASKALPDTEVESTAGWLYSGKPHPHAQAPAKSPRAPVIDKSHWYPEPLHGSYSVPAPPNHAFKPACKESTASPRLSDSTGSPAWSARSTEMPSSQEATPAAQRRLPARIHRAQDDGATSGSEGSDAESLVPRSNSSASLNDDQDLTPRLIADGAGGQAVMPVTFPAPDAVPWAAERLYVSQRSTHTGYTEGAFAGLFMDPSVDQVPGTTFAISTGILQPSSNRRVLPSSKDWSCRFRESMDHIQTQCKSFSEHDVNAQCVERASVSSESETLLNGKLISDSEQTTTVASSSDIEVFQTTTSASHSSDSEEDQARRQTITAHDMNGQLRSIDDEMQELMQSLASDMGRPSENRARMHTMKAWDMTGKLDNELRSIDDEMQELMQDLLRLKDHVAAAKPRIINN